jgi:PEP-CTERM/exosortase A-associated glycosyltransferase
MVVLHVFHHSLPFKQSGYDIRSQYILKSLNNIGIKAYGFTGPYYLPPEKEATVEGIRYFFTRVPRRGGIILIPILIRYRLGKLIKSLQPDVIHGHTCWLTALPALKVARRRGIPFVYEVRGVWEETEVTEGMTSENSRKYKLWRKRENEVLRGADRVITISEGLRQEVLARGILSGQHVEVVPNGVDTIKFCPLPKDEKLAETLGLKGKLVLGYISSLTRMEGISYLVSAMEKIDKKVSLLIVGDGPKRQAIEEQVKRLRLSSRVSMPGLVPHDDILRYYSLIDIFVVPRINAKICHLVVPLKPVEAMAMGKCVLVSRVKGLTEIITDGKTGLTFEPENPIDLSLKINTLMADAPYRERLGQAALEYVRAERQWDTLCQKYRKIYESL